MKKEKKQKNRHSLAQTHEEETMGSSFQDVCSENKMPTKVKVEEEDIGLGNKTVLDKVDKLRALNVGMNVPLPQVSLCQPAGIIMLTRSVAHRGRRSVVWKVFCPGEPNRIFLPTSRGALYSLRHSDHLSSRAAGVHGHLYHSQAICIGL